MLADQVVAGAQHTCASLQNFITSEGKFAFAGIKCWGKNEYGQLGVGDTQSRGAKPEDMGNNLPRVEVDDLHPSEPTYVSYLAAGAAHTCAVITKGSDVVPIEDVDLDAYSNQTIIPHEKILYADFETNQKPKGFDLPRTESKKYPEVGPFLNYKKGRDVVKCWGYGRLGQLGTGSNQNVGDTPGQMGSSLESVKFSSRVDFGKPCTTNCAGHQIGWHKIKSLSLGSYHSCAIVVDGDMEFQATDPFTEDQHKLPKYEYDERCNSKPDGDISHCKRFFPSYYTFCWGWNAFGQLGFDHTRNIGATGDTQTLSRLDLGTQRFFGTRTIENQPPNMKNLANFDDLTIMAVDIAAGYAHTCAHVIFVEVDYDDDPMKFKRYLSYRGLYSVDQLAREVENGASPYSKFIEGKILETALMSVMCWGSNEYGQLGLRSWEYDDNGIARPIHVGFGYETTMKFSGLRYADLGGMYDMRDRARELIMKGIVKEEDVAGISIDSAGTQMHFFDTLNYTACGNKTTRPCIITEENYKDSDVVPTWPTDDKFENPLWKLSHLNFLNVRKIAVGGHHTCAIIQAKVSYRNKFISDYTGNYTANDLDMSHDAIARSKYRTYPSIYAYTTAKSRLKCWGLGEQGQTGFLKPVLDTQYKNIGSLKYNLPEQKIEGEGLSMSIHVPNGFIPDVALPLPAGVSPKIFLSSSVQFELFRNDPSIKFPPMIISLELGSRHTCVGWISQNAKDPFQKRYIFPGLGPILSRTAQFGSMPLIRRDNTDNFATLVPTSQVCFGDGKNGKLGLSNGNTMNVGVEDIDNTGELTNVTGLTPISVGTDSGFREDQIRSIAAGSDFTCAKMSLTPAHDFNCTKFDTRGCWNGSYRERPSLQATDFEGRTRLNVFVVPRKFESIDPYVENFKSFNIASDLRSFGGMLRSPYYNFSESVLSSSHKYYYDKNISYGQLEGQPIVAGTATGDTWTALSGSSMALPAPGLLSAHAVMCWGRGIHGSLGNGDGNDVGARANELQGIIPVDLGTTCGLSNSNFSATKPQNMCPLDPKYDVDNDYASCCELIGGINPSYTYDPTYFMTGQGIGTIEPAKKSWSKIAGYQWRLQEGEPRKTVSAKQPRRNLFQAIDDDEQACCECPTSLMQTSPKPSDSKSVNVAAIAGGVVAAIVVCCCVIFAVALRRRMRKVECTVSISITVHMAGSQELIMQYLNDVIGRIVAIPPVKFNGKERDGSTLDIETRAGQKLDDSMLLVMREDPTTIPSDATVLVVSANIVFLDLEHHENQLQFTNAAVETLRDFFSDVPNATVEANINRHHHELELDSMESSKVMPFDGD